MKILWILIFCLFVCLTKQIQEDIKQNLKQEKSIIETNRLKIELLKELEIQNRLKEALELIDSDEKQTQKKGVQIFEDLIKDHQSSEAMYQLGLYFRNGDHLSSSSSQKWLLKSSLRGNAKAQYEVGFLYHYKLMKQEVIDSVYSEEGEEKFDLSKYDHKSLALLNFVSSAYIEDIRSQILLGYKFYKGYGVVKDCQKASKYYSNAAAFAKKYYEKGGAPFTEKVKLDDENAISFKQSQADIMDYYQYSANKGVSSSHLILGYANMYGIRGFEQNSEAARTHFESAAEAGENEAYGPLGNMYLKGIGVKQDNETAMKYFEKGSEKGDLSSYNGLGFIYANGFGVEKDLTKAAKYFEMSSNKGNPEGQYNLGLFYMTGKGVTLNYKNAYNLMTAAAAQHQTLANYYLGVMHLKGLGATKDCELAVKFFKTIVDKGPHTKIMDEAYDLYLSGDFLESLLKYSEASELGFDIAQINSAHIIDKALIDEDDIDIEEFKSSLTFHQMAADQNHVASLVKLGDFYYYGIGTKVDIEKSLMNYRKASDMRNAQAVFNLGYMHELGIGLKQDFHLAKRYYDLAKETNKKAYPPVFIALSRLYIKWAWKLLNFEGFEQLKTMYGNDALELFGHFENFIFLMIILSFIFFVWLRILLGNVSRNVVHEHQD
eukprot:gene4750-8332_t